MSFSSDYLLGTLGFVGSGTITITPVEGGLKVEIFNITSLTSGDYCKSSSASDDWPKSYARNPASTTPIKYGNISETFNLFIPNPPVLQPVSTPAGGW